MFILPNCTNIAWASTYCTKSEAISYKQKQAARIVFDEDRFCHPRTSVWYLKAFMFIK